MSIRFRIGQGYDVHAFCEGRCVILGGVEIPFDRGLAAHSDGDVLLHSICDALLGAAAMGDIGVHFPDCDERYKEVSSRLLLEQVRAIIGRENWRAVNIDSTVVAQAPRIQPFVGKMRQNIAADLALAPDCVNIKATTTEGLGFVGRREGIAAGSIALIERF